MNVFNGGFSIANLLSKTKRILSHLEGANTSILEEIVAEEHHLSFLEKTASQLKENRRALRRHAMQNSIQIETRERDTSARSSVQNLQLIRQNNLPNSIQGELESNFKSASKLGGSTNPSYLDLNVQEKLPSRGHSQNSVRAAMVSTHIMNLYHSSGIIKPDLLEESNLKSKEVRPAPRTKDLLIPEAEPTPNKPNEQLAHRRMNSPKATSRLMDILDQIGKVKQSVTQLSQPPSSMVRVPGSVLQAPKPAPTPVGGHDSGPNSVQSRSPTSQGLQRQKLGLVSSPSISINITQFGLTAPRQNRAPGALSIGKVRSAENFQKILDSQQGGPRQKAGSPSHSGFTISGLPEKRPTDTLPHQH